MKHIFFTLTFLLALPALAQDVVQLPDGHTALNISATEQVEVEQDMLVASLRIEEEGKDAKTVQKAINEAMAKAVELGKKYPSLRVETGRYHVRPDYRYIKTDDQNNKRVLDKWRGSQTLILKSQVATDVLDVTGEIQDMGFLMNNLNYQLSPKKYNETRDGLMEQTITALRARAMRVARALGKDDVDFVEINVDAHSRAPRPVYARSAKMEMVAMSADSSMSAPVAEAGETTVSMSINARAIIK
jgi:predicted secreted protein